MQRQTLSHPVSLFCIATPIDAALLAQWEKHLLPLQQNGLLTCWSEQHLQVGEDRTKQRAAHLAQADYLVLLLSADFFADDDCLTLMHEALLLQREHENHLRIIPLLVRPVEWKESALGTFPCLPSNGVAITTWEHPDAGWHQAVQGVRHILDRISPQAVAPLGKRAATDRERMIRLLRRTYQATLDSSLQDIAWITLNLAERQDAVRNATHLLQYLPDHSERVLPIGTSMLDAYDQAEEALLILGDPGTGKSTLLLDLALRLLERAEVDETHPLPAILPLSSWAVNKPELSGWMVEQLARIYDVPRKLGQQWVHQGQVLPHLDGLDEMEETARPLCIVAINAYRKEHVTPLVVCSRKDEYQVASTSQRLLLQNAVMVQPLSQKQVEQVIQQGGEPLAALNEELQDSQELRDLAATPLMLSVLILAYHGITVDDLPQQQDALEQRVWTDYVERMVREKGAERQGRGDIPIKCYTLKQTCSWLSWLAQQMRNHNQTLFHGEQLQASWMPVSQQRAVVWLIDRTPAMLLGVWTSLLLWFFIGYAADPARLCQDGLIGGFLGWCVCINQRTNTSAGGPQSPGKHLLQAQGHHFLRAGSLAILVAASFSLDLNGQTYFWFDWVRDGLIFGGCLLPSAWLLQIVFLSLFPLPLSPRPTSCWVLLSQWLQTTPTRRALWTAAILGISFAVSNGLSIGLSNGLGQGVSNGLSFGFSNGLSFGGTIYLLCSLLDGQTQVVRLAERISWTWLTLLSFRHLRASLIIALSFMCLYGLSQGLSYGLSMGLSYGLSIGLSQGLRLELSQGLSIGLSQGLSYGLSYWLLLGLYKGLTQDHLEEQDRRQFNQGIHRSLRNGVGLSMLGAGIIAGISVLSYVLSTGLITGLSNGLSNGLIVGLRDGWLLLLCGWVVLWAATGGLTIQRHYMLRLLLARSHTFPLYARRFLDDATARVLLRRIGGGYGFVHRRLLDYFADTTLLLADTSDAPHQSSPMPQSVSDSVSRSPLSESQRD